MGKSKQVILVIGDLHCPYEHPDTVAFLTAVKKKYKPTRVVQLGDEVDFHSLSFHDHNPDLPSPKDELALAREHLKPIYKLFPKVDVIESNHGSLVYRRAMANGLPQEVLRSYREVLHAPEGWNWHFDLTIETPLGPVYFHHGKSSSVGKLSQSQSMNAVQGHFHSKFYIFYWASPVGLYWDANAGCLADDKSLAMGYGKNTLPRPIVGCMVIEDGIPQLIPMVLKKGGRWVGKL